MCCPSTGPEQADLLLVGEALGANEEEAGRPFVGDAGRKLTYALHRADIDRKSCRIGNACRCRPPRNRKPKKVELVACYPYLLMDILRGKPKAIVALGATAISQLLPGPKVKVDEWRGFPSRQSFRYESQRTGKVYEHECWVIPTFHPSACLHKWELDDLLIHDLRLAADYAAGREVLTYPDTRVNVARTFDQAMQLLRRLRQAASFVVDVELGKARPEDNAFSPFEAKLLCVGFCLKPGEAHVLPLLRQHCQAMWKPDEYRQIVAGLTDVLSEARLEGQNLKFDLKHLRRLTGIVDFNVRFDTMLASHVINENRPHNLTFLCQWYLRWQKYDAAMTPYKAQGYQAAPDEVLWRYNGYDVDGTKRLIAPLQHELEEQKLRAIFKTELDLTLPLADVEYRGVHADRSRIIQLGLEYRRQQDAAKRKLDKIALKLLGPERGSHFNANAPKQLVDLLQAAGAKLRRTTKSGATSADKHVMAALAVHENRAGRVAKAVRELRKTTKYISTYLDGRDGAGGFLGFVAAKDRLHPNYNVANARTGRLSSDDPPVQTLPRTGGMRGIIIPDDPVNHLFLSADYEKIELCVMAYRANDEVMCPELISGVDLHRRMAITAFRLHRDPTDEEFAKLAPLVTAQERGLAKQVNFGVPYGRGSQAIVRSYPENFPVDMPREKRLRLVDRIIAAYFEKYWGVRDYLEAQIELAHKRHYLRTYTLGRKRRFTGLDWYQSKWGLKCSHSELDVHHIENEARNCEIQSIASDTLSRATRRCYDQIRQARIPGLRMVITLHDQIIFNCDRRYIEESEALIRGAMETRLPADARHRFEMPLRVEIHRQKVWGVDWQTGEDEYTALPHEAGQPR